MLSFTALFQRYFTFPIIKVANAHDNYSSLKFIHSGADQLRNVGSVSVFLNNCLPNHSLIQWNHHMIQNKAYSLSRIHILNPHLHCPTSPCSTQKRIFSLSVPKGWGFFSPVGFIIHFLCSPSFTTVTNTYWVLIMYERLWLALQW